MATYDAVSSYEEEPTIQQRPPPRQQEIMVRRRKAQRDGRGTSLVITNCLRLQWRAGIVRDSPQHRRIDHSGHDGNRSLSPPWNNRVSIYN